MKYYTLNPKSAETNFHTLVAKTGDIELDSTTFASAEESKGLIKSWGTTALHVDEGKTLHEDVAIGRYLAKIGSKKDQLIGTCAYSQSRVDQWTNWVSTHIRPFTSAIDAHINKSSEVALDLCSAACSLKKALKLVDTQLGETTHLAGNELTVADLHLASQVTGAFLHVLDKEFQKGHQNLTLWFVAIIKLESFKAIHGAVKLCTKSIAGDAKPKVEEVKGDQNAKKGKADKKDKGDKQKQDKKEKAPKEGKEETKGEKQKGDKKGKAKPAKEETAGVPENVEFADPIYEKYKGIFENAVYGKVVTRFPPEPSGFLHIGHIKASMLNYHYAKIYNGKMICRFDDTNPSKEKVEFVENIKKDLATCQIIPDKVTHTSDYFDLIIEKMKKFIEIGMAYADDTNADLMKEQRDAGIESPNKTKTPQETLAIFEEMLAGKATQWCIRANLDMSNPVKCLRDPVMFRCNATPHHETGTKYKAYPTYDFACPIVDAEEGVTNTLRTIEYKDRDALYHLILEKLGYQDITIFEYAKLQLKSTLMSKRKLQWFVDQGLVDGWNDPRFPTVQGLMRRGLTVQTLKEFMLEQGPSLNTVRMEWDKLWAINKKNIDPTSKRYFAIMDDSAAEVIIENGPEFPEGKTIQYHRDHPELGSKVRILANRIFIEKEDLADLQVGSRFALKDWVKVEIKSIEEHDGKTKVIATMDPEDKNFKKIVFSTFVPADDNLHTKITIYEFGHLITIDNLKEEMNVEDYVNHNSKIKTTGYAEKDIERAKKGDFLQIERRGYFYVDKDIENDGEIVLHFTPDGKTKNMSKISSKIDSNALSRGEGAGKKAANSAEQAKIDGPAPVEGDQPLSKNALKKLANKEKKKAKKQEHKAGPTEEDAKQDK